MGWIRDTFLRENSAVTKADLANVEHLFENASGALARLELAYEDRGWELIRGNARNEFTREGLVRAAELAGVMVIANPLMKRGTAIRHAYIWGQGLQITARAQGQESGEQDVNAVVQDFLDDEGNREAVFGAQARERWEKNQATCGNYFIACFTDPLTGRVQVRTIDFGEIVEIIHDPGDRAKPQFYLRQWTESGVDAKTGVQISQTKQAYYPALKYQPAMKVKTLNKVPVMWDTPIYHEKVNGLSHWQYGIGDAYAALPWARGYKEFLEDWATLCKALSRLAFKAKSGKASAAQGLRNQLQNLNSLPAGSVAAMTSDGDLEAIPKTGATLDSESGRPLAAMVAAALGVTVTILLADPGTTGARAVAETLDLPMRLEMQGRQEVHGETLQALLGYVVEQAVMCPRGPLKGTTVRDGDRLFAKFTDDTDATIEIVWPDLDEVPLADLMKAIVEADGTGKLPPMETLKLILRALKIRDIDNILTAVTDEKGNYIDPQVTAGDKAVQDFRAGKDPARFDQ